LRYKINYGHNFQVIRLTTGVQLYKAHSSKPLSIHYLLLLSRDNVYVHIPTTACCHNCRIIAGKSNMDREDYSRILEHGVFGKEIAHVIPTILSTISGKLMEITTTPTSTFSNNLYDIHSNKTHYLFTIDK